MDNSVATIPKKRISFYISIAFLSGIVIYLIQYFVTGFILDGVFALFGRDWLKTEWLYVLANSLLYLLSLAGSAVLLLVVFKKSPFSGFSGPLSCPRLPFLYIPVTIGALYLLNIIVNTAFGDLLVPFDTPISADSFPHSPVGVAAYLIYLSVLPAVFEEWLFRGILQKNLATVMSRRWAIVISSLIFGFMHVDPGQTVFAIGFGLFAGYAFDTTGSIWFGVLIHLLNNAVSGCATYWLYVYGIEESSAIFGIYMLTTIVIAVIGIPVYLATRGKQPYVRPPLKERMLPRGKSVLKAIVSNPFLYLMLACYCGLIWVLYFV